MCFTCVMGFKYKYLSSERPPFKVASHTSRAMCCYLQCSRYPCIQNPQTKPAQVLLSSPAVRHLVGTVAKMAAAFVFNHDRVENPSTLEMGYKKKMVDVP